MGQTYKEKSHEIIFHNADSVVSKIVDQWSTARGSSLFMMISFKGVIYKGRPHKGEGLANADTCVNFVCKGKILRAWREGVTMATFCGRPLWMAPKVRPVARGVRGVMTPPIKLGFN